MAHTSRFYVKPVSQAFAEKAATDGLCGDVSHTVKQAHYPGTWVNVADRAKPSSTPKPAPPTTNIRGRSPPRASRPTYTGRTPDAESARKPPAIPPVLSKAFARAPPADLRASIEETLQ
ncbi:hypothetical protein LTR35_000564 [Friedmanniomyces endolithicus]|uniref:Uncharacterized protein n=1 Tax=Friedmanniomyces endolithicus TaxID=329885 RepID=A0AAN6F8Y7_9PEZI|nr:hypothetical protein LTS00_013996 [Friedmanniomyces endolithicus]KAK0292535.1 hypothetical protein LTR35_000564 [Friedmanniomyces endolithicus]KAK0309711.1 hypothetical protein LTR82_015064 [Friedmanniomyces endolithicus]